MLTFLLVLVVLTLVAVVVGIGLYVRRLDEAVGEIRLSLREFRETIGPLSDDVRQVLANTDGLVTSAREQMHSVGRITQSVENLVEGKTIVDAAGKAVSSSKSTLVSMLEGIRQGLKALRTIRKDKENEQQS